MATQTRKKERKKERCRRRKEEEEEEEEELIFKGGILRAVMSNSFVFIMIAAGLCFIICQGWPQCCCHKSLVQLVQAVCNK
jgi:hypothetical protein